MKREGVKCNGKGVGRRVVFLNRMVCFFLEKVVGGMDRVDMGSGKSILYRGNSRCTCLELGGSR